MINAKFHCDTEISCSTNKEINVIYLQNKHCIRMTLCIIHLEYLNIYIKKFVHAPSILLTIFHAYTKVFYLCRFGIGTHKDTVSDLLINEKANCGYRIIIYQQ